MDVFECDALSSSKIKMDYSILVVKKGKKDTIC